MPKTSSLYERRITENVCTRCGHTKKQNETRRQCIECRQRESLMRKRNRDENRSQKEHDYHVRTWAKRILTHSRRSDKLKDRPVIEQLYITEKQLHQLRKFQMNRCYYCNIEMQVNNRRQPNGLTSERLYPGCNPHTSDNVVLCCHKCNCSRVGKKNTNKGLSIYYNIWKNYKLTL